MTQNRQRSQTAAATSRAKHSNNWAHHAGEMHRVSRPARMSEVMQTDDQLNAPFMQSNRHLAVSLQGLVIKAIFLRLDPAHSSESRRAFSPRSAISRSRSAFSHQSQAKPHGSPDYPARLLPIRRLITIVAFNRRRRPVETPHRKYSGNRRNDSELVVYNSDTFMLCVPYFPPCTSHSTIVRQPVLALRSCYLELLPSTSEAGISKSTVPIPILCEASGVRSAEVSRIFRASAGRKGRRSKWNPYLPPCECPENCRSTGRVPHDPQSPVHEPAKQQAHLQNPFQRQIKFSAFQPGRHPPPRSIVSSHRAQKVRSGLLQYRRMCASKTPQCGKDRTRIVIAEHCQDPGTGPQLRDPLRTGSTALAPAFTFRREATRDHSPPAFTKFPVSTIRSGCSPLTIPIARRIGTTEKYSS